MQLAKLNSPTVAISGRVAQIHCCDVGSLRDGRSCSLRSGFDDSRVQVGVLELLKK